VGKWRDLQGLAKAFFDYGLKRTSFLLGALLRKFDQSLVSFQHGPHL
jgi:hypothetical protein